MTSIINGTGRRKTAIARVYLRSGDGTIKVNGCALTDYFRSKIHQDTVKQPLTKLNLEGQYDIMVNVAGGGATGQAEAINLGVARALVRVNQEHKPVLKQDGLLTCDSRVVERKKYGRKKARRSFQFSKR